MTSLRAADRLLTLVKVAVLGKENSTSPRCTVRLVVNATSRETQARSSRPDAPKPEKSMT